MRRMRSKLNNLAYPTENGANPPPVAVQGVGPNRQTSAIQNHLQAAGIYPQQMMPEMYGPGGYTQPFEQQPYPHMQPGMQQAMMPPMPMAPQMQMPQQAPMVQPNMYPASQQMAQPAAESEMDHVRAGLNRLSANIQQLASNNPVGGQDALQVQKQNEMITAELMELRKQISQASANGQNQDLSSQMEAIRQAVEAALAKSTNPDTFASAVEASHRKITDELYEFKNALSNNNSNPELFAQTFEARHDEISRSINDLQHSINAAIGNPGLYAETVENSHRELSQQFEEFKHTMLEQAAANQQTDEPDFSSLEMRLEEITRAIVALSTGNQSQDGLERIEARINDLSKTISIPQINADSINMPNYDEHFNQVHHDLQMLESRLTELQTVERSDNGSLDMQIQQISDKMDAISSANSQVNEASQHGVEGLEQQITMLSEKLDNIASISGEKFDNVDGEASTGSDNSALMSRLDELVGEVVHLRADNSNDQTMANRMNDLVSQLETLNTNQPTGDEHTNQIIEHLKGLSQSVDKLSQRDASTMQNVDLSSLETQLNHVSEQLNSGSQQTSAEGLPIDEISQRLTGIEQQIGASRDIAIELASQAAADAVERTMKEMPTASANGEGLENLALQEISQNIQNLNDQTASAHAQYNEKIDAMKSSLTELADRNNKLESKLENLDEASAALASDDYQTQAVDSEELIHNEPQLEDSVEQFEDSVEQVQESVEQVEEDIQLIPEEPYQEYVPEEGLTSQHSEEVSYNHPPEQDETSTADLINKIRENSRAEQTQAEETNSGQNSQIQAEQVLAEAAGLKVETSVQEVTPVYDDMVASDVQQIPVETMPYAVAEQAIPSQAHQDDYQQFESHSQLPHVDVPSLAAEHDDNQLLEPGGVGPDLAALVRQVNERRMDTAQNSLGGSGSDFLASARRAAQAAAQEANMVEEEIEQKEKKGLLASLPALLAKKKKALLIGVVAVAMIAIALPFITGSSTSSTEELASEKTVVIEQSETADASDSVYSEEPVNEEEQGALVDDAQEITIDDTVDNVVTPAAAAETQDPIEAAQSEVNEENEVSEAAQTAPDNSGIPQYDVSELSFVTPALKDAVQNGNLTAMFEVGRQYTNGEATKKDLSKAAIWYERAANHGHVPAQYMIGNFNEKGFGMEPNVENAVTWYEKAAGQGNVIAMHNLGVLYATPGKLNAEPDMGQAFGWFKKAADYGVRDSQVNMGIFYTQGLGTEVNLTEAYKWFSIASVGGDADAKKKLLIIEERLRPEQKEAAKTLVENWKPIKADPAANEVTTLEGWKTKSASQPVANNINRKTIQQTQAVLNKLGYKAGNPDGIMGRQTQAAISKYQKTEGLKVTGTINPELVKSLIAKMSG